MAHELGDDSLIGFVGPLHGSVEMSPSIRRTDGYLCPLAGPGQTNTKGVPCIGGVATVQENENGFGMLLGLASVS